MSPAYSYSIPASASLADETAAEGRPTLREAAVGTASIMIMWALGYCLPNALNTLRHCSWAWAASWEASLPYYGWMVVPYLSMNVLYGFAPFCCGSRAELRALVRRMAVAIGVAATCFLLYPTRLPESKPDPVTDLDRLYYRLLNIDFPNNCFPSLHVAFALILASVYTRPFRGWRRWAVGSWFALIALSTVLARQHFVLDATAGLVLGWAACRWIRVPATSAESDAGPILLPFEEYRTLRMAQAADRASTARSPRRRIRAA
jgi:membrane-associated phospholipid phosphatase